MTAPQNPSAPRPWHGVDHYENFPVASWFVPPRQRPAVAALYRFARHADDVADEGDLPAAARLAELEALERALLDPARRHPAVEGMRPFLAAHPNAVGDCRDLLLAFRQDVGFSRHPDYASLRAYCERSAAPVGRLLLEMFDCREPELVALSDAICCALQLINFTQDTARDWARGRLYVPTDEAAAHGVSDADFERAALDGRADTRLRGLMGDQVRRAARLLEAGAPLARRVPWRLGLELRGVLAGGRRIVELLARDGCDPFARRPALGAADALALLRLAVMPPRRFDREAAR
jgi:phytoene synthase